MRTMSIIKTENSWTSLQEARGSAQLSNSYSLLLSALDQGWRIVKVELAPSWDQYGFIYLVTLKHHSRKHSQQLILPKNYTVKNLIHSFIFPNERGQRTQLECK
jgi:hypothetical protein